MNYKKVIRYGAELLIMLALIFGIYHWQAKDMLSTDGSQVISPVTLVSLQGEVQPLYEQGTRTLVYFWAPWCRVCALSIGSIVNVDRENLHVVTVAMDFASVESVSDFVTQHNVTSKVLLGNQQIAKQFQVPGYPSYYLLDEQGQVVARSIGFNTSIGIKLNDWLSKI